MRSDSSDLRNNAIPPVVIFIRILAITLGAIEALATIAIVALLLVGESDPLGRAISQGIINLLIIPFVLCVLPGLVLAFANRFIYVALALIISALPVTIILWRGA